MSKRDVLHVVLRAVVQGVKSNVVLAVYSCCLFLLSIRDVVHAVLRDVFMLFN